MLVSGSVTPTRPNLNQPNPKFTPARPRDVDTVMGKVGFQFRRSTGQGLAGPKGRPGRDMAFSKQKTSEKTCPPQHFYSEREKNTNILQLPAFVERSKQKQYFLKCCDKRAKKVSQWLVSLIVPVALSVFDEST